MKNLFFSRDTHVPIRATIQRIVVLCGMFFSLTTILQAQVTVLGSTTTASQTNTLSGFTVPAGNARLLVVTASDGLAMTITNVTYNGTPLTKRAERTDGTAVDAVFTLALGNSASSSSGTIVITSPNGTHLAKFVSARVFQKVDQTTPITGVQSSASVVLPLSSTLVVPSKSGDLVFDVFDTWNVTLTGLRIEGSGQLLGCTSAGLNFGVGLGFGYYGTSTKPGAAPTTTMSWSSAIHLASIHIAMNIQQDMTTLPLKLLSFTAVQGNETVLHWKTADEINTSRFDIERSTDGTSFDKIGSTTATPSSAEKNYSYTDGTATAAFASVEKLYYRLKMIDQDGKFSYSPVVLVSNKVKTSFVLNTKPNPFTDKITVSLNMQENTMVNIMLTDMSGRIIQRKQVSVGKGFSTQSLEGLAQLDRGIYMLQVKAGNETITSKVVK